MLPREPGFVAGEARWLYTGAMPNQSTKARLIASKTSLKELIDHCPELWRETGEEINRRLAPGPQAAATPLNEYVRGLQAKADAWGPVLAKSRNDRTLVDKAFPDIMRARLARLALQNYFLAAQAGKAGKLRFNLWNGSLLQKLLFRRGFERKPVSLFWYALVWRLVGQKNILMRLVYRKGIYCFYSAALVRRLAALIRQVQDDETPALEIAAGDGTLSRFLRERGIDCVATDDLSWEASAKAVADLPEGQLEALSAQDALRAYPAKAVICSWPPAGNPFEAAVFKSSHTQLYLVIASRHRFASGNWECYGTWADPVPAGSKPGAPVPGTRAFTMELDEGLSRLVLPRELDSVVLVFRRRALP